jgi:hypothetical protein
MLFVRKAISATRKLATQIVFDIYETLTLIDKEAPSSIFGFQIAATGEGLQLAPLLTVRLTRRMSAIPPKPDCAATVNASGNAAG